jgi:hypothetical protein
MQAQPQSNLAARIPSSPALPPSSATPLLKTQPAPSLAETSGLAHDAGNLLAALGLYCDLLKVPGVLRPEHQHYATELALIADRSTRLIRRLLAASPADTQQAPLPEHGAPLLLPPALLRRRNARSSDILPSASGNPATLLDLAPVLQRIAAGAAKVTVICPASLPPLPFPSEIIERITVNLVRNAAEAMRLQQASTSPLLLAPSGEIRVTLTLIPGYLQLTVEDNGPGMTPANVTAYLQPQPLPLGAVHGIGHRVVHELTTASEGQLSISVRPGQGTDFCLTWPIHAPSPEPRPSDVPSNLSTT